MTLTRLSEFGAAFLLRDSHGQFNARRCTRAQFGGSLFVERTLSSPKEKKTDLEHECNEVEQHPCFQHF